MKTGLPTDLTQPERDRLAFIGLRLRFVDEIRRQDLASRFGDGFKPVFDFPSERVLTWLSQSYGDGEPAILSPWIIFKIPSRLAHCDLDTRASDTRTIHNECPLKIIYHSIYRGNPEREIIPFSLIDNGLHWHVQAFDWNMQNFRELVITRTGNQS